MVWRSHRKRDPGSEARRQCPLESGQLKSQSGGEFGGEQRVERCGRGLVCSLGRPLLELLDLAAVQPHRGARKRRSRSRAIERPTWRTWGATHEQVVALGTTANKTHVGSWQMPQNVELMESELACNHLTGDESQICRFGVWVLIT